MHFRCPACRAASWADEVSTGAEVCCTACDSALQLGNLDALETDSKLLFRQARRISERRGIDIPSAYSVLLGLLDEKDLEPSAVGVPVLAAAGTVSSGKPAAGTETPEASGPGRTGAAREDPADLKQRVERLMKRNRLPRALATQVARGETTLSAAMLVRPSELLAETPTEDDSASRSGNRSRGSARRRRGGAARNETRLNPGVLAICAGGLLLTIALVWMGTRPASPASEPGARRLAPAGTEIRRDAEGQALEIVGPDAESVLTAFCTGASKPGQRMPIEIVLESSAESGRRLGLFREAGAGGVRAISIRRDRNARRWVTGDGRTRIRPFDPPDIPPGAARFPVHAGSGR